MIIGVKTWALIVGVACVVAAFIGTAIARWQWSPQAIPACNDAVAIVSTEAHTLVNCNPGERIEIERQGVVILAKCLCPSVRR